jgi:hypothetical protein
MIFIVSTSLQPLLCVTLCRSVYIHTDTCFYEGSSSPNDDDELLLGLAGGLLATALGLSS